MSLLQRLFAGVEWPMVALLAGIVLWEELRKLPPGAVLFRAPLSRPFEPVESPPGRRVVGLWPPLTTSFIVFPRTAAGPVGWERGTRARGDRGTGGPGDGTGAPLTLGERYAEIRRWFVWFRILAGLAVLLIVLGVPLAAAWLGGTGLLVVLGFTLVWSVGIALLGYRAAGRAGVPAQLRRVPFLSLLSPFAAPRVVEILLELIVREETAVAVAAVVMEREAFRAWVRPRVWDALHGGAADPELEAVLSVEEQRALTGAVPEGAVAGEGYCPRCGATYRESVGRCGGCGVEVVGVE